MVSFVEKKSKSLISVVGGTLVLMFGLGSLGFADDVIPGVQPESTKKLFQAAIRFKRSCPIFKKPSLSSPKICLKDKNDKLTAFSEPIRPAGSRVSFLRTISSRCAGFVPTACVLVSKQKLQPREARKTASDRTQEIENIKYHRLGLSINADAIAAAVTYSTEPSSGLGYSAQIKYAHQLNRLFRGTVGAGYQIYRLSRSFTLSGATVTGGADTAQQTINFASGLIYGGFLISKTKEKRRRPSGISVAGESAPKPPQSSTTMWLEGGLEFLYPLSATQTGDLTADISVTENTLLGVGGLVADFPQMGPLALSGHLMVVFNLSATSAGRFYGARLGLAIQSVL